MLKKSSYIFLFFFCNTSIAQTFLNGDFELNTVTAGQDQINLSNAAFNAFMPDCNSFGTTGNIDIITSSVFSGGPQSGNWFVALTGGGTDLLALSLSAPLVAGNSYTVSFYDKADIGFVPQPVEIGLSVTNNDFGITIYTAPAAAVIGAWTLRSFTFLAPNNGQFITVTQPGTTQTWVHVDHFTLENNNFPVADFTASDTAFCQYNCVHFTDMSTGHPSSWNWTFTGGTPGTSAVQNPGNICYSVPGSYPVSLMVSNTNATNSTTRNGYITVNPSYIQTVFTSICPGTMYTFPDGAVASKAVTDTSHLATVNGCDSMIITHLDVNPVYSRNNPQEICDGESYSVQSHAYTATGNYYDTLATVAGCDSILMTSLTVQPRPLLSFSHPDDLCMDAPEITLHYATPGGGDYSGAGVRDNIFYPQSASAGTHLLTYTYHDPLTGCPNKIYDEITVHPLPDVMFSMDPKSTTLENPGISFVDLTSGSVDRLWNFGDGVHSLLNPVSHVYSDTGCFPVSLLVTDINGCKNSSADFVYVREGLVFYIPDAFSPNGDGKNDFFSGTGTGFVSFHMTIFDRWGNTLFETNDIQQPWNGSNMPAGEYVYKIRLIDLAGVAYDYVGKVSIIR